jgi:hypothetical protein
VARRFGLHVADGINASLVAELAGFRAKELPLLLPLMSEEARVRFSG